MSLEVLKDLLGLVGSILAIVPFMRDFAQRRTIRRWLSYVNSIPVFRKRTAAVAAAEEKKLREPNSADMLFIMAGIFLLIVSFAISLYISVHGAAKA